MASEESIYPASSPIPEKLRFLSTCNPWSSPVVQATRFLAPSTPSSDASSLTLDEDEDDWTTASKRHASKLLASREPDGESFPSERKVLSHSEWLHHFAEQARRAHMRNTARSTFALSSSPSVPTVFCPFDDAATFSPDFVYEKPEPSFLEVKQPWLSAFRRGCVTVDSKARRVHAQNVVALGSWDADSLEDLANKVIDRVSEGYGEGFAVLAPFVRDIVKCLGADVGEEEAEQFKDALHEYLLVEFAVWWDMDLPTSVGMLRYELNWDVYRFYDIAFAIATFVGDAFAHSLLPAGAVHHCLALLIRKLSILEQVQAVHAIVTHAHAGLYDGRTLLLLMSVFKFRAGRVPVGTTVLGEPFREEDVRVYTQAVSGLVERWVKAGPSQRQEADLQDEETDDVMPAPVARPTASSGCALRIVDDSDEVVSTRPGPQAKRSRPAPLSYSDAVKKRKKT